MPAVYSLPADVLVYFISGTGIAQSLAAPGVCLFSPAQCDMVSIVTVDFKLITLKHACVAVIKLDARGCTCVENLHNCCLHMMFWDRCCSTFKHTRRPFFMQNLCIHIYLEWLQSKTIQDLNSQYFNLYRS